MKESSFVTFNFLIGNNDNNIRMARKLKVRIDVCQRTLSDLKSVEKRSKRCELPLDSSNKSVHMRALSFKGNTILNFGPKIFKLIT